MIGRFDMAWFRQDMLKASLAVLEDQRKERLRAEEKARRK